MVVLSLNAITVMGADPIVTIKSLNEEGVVLLPYDSPEFAAAAAPFTSIKERAALLPYAVLIKNRTNHDIMSYSVRWTPIGTDGLPAKPQLLTPRSFRGATVIEAGASKLVSFVDSITLPPEVQDAALHRQMTRAAEFYRAQQSIEISLELVVFDDGTAIGPDRDGKLATLRAWRDAERDFSAQARSVEDPEAFSLTVRQIRDQGLQSLPPADSRDIHSLLLQAEISNDYTVSYRFARAYFAAQVAGWIEQTDAKSAQQKLNLITGRKRYVSIQRRKGGQ
jgi:hypothetical protein